MLTLVKLTNAEYLITSVASGLEDYYVGSGEAPGVWLCNPASGRRSSTSPA